MRHFAAKYDTIPPPADTHSTIVLVANTAQASDWPTDAYVVRVTGATTASTVPFAFCMNAVSTFAVWGSSFALSTASSGQNFVVTSDDPKMFRRPSGSTGFSVAGPAAGVVGIEFWRV